LPNEAPEVSCAGLVKEYPTASGTVRLRPGPSRAREGRTEELLSLFGLTELADRSPSQTSLGQQQRAAVARSLVLTPLLALADGELSERAL
jgi:ABC-type Fe3+/spermidine/putrescine transport system ATPase subunit